MPTSEIKAQVKLELGPLTCPRGGGRGETLTTGRYQPTGSGSSAGTGSRAECET